MAGDGIGLEDVPWPLLRRWIAAIRRRYFTVPWPDDAPALVVVQPPGDLEHRLRTQEAFEGTPYSYRYEGAVLDLRRPWGLHADGGPLELHVRGRPLEDGAKTLLVAHVEYSRYECKQRHVDQEHVDWRAGQAAMGEILQDAVTARRN